MTHLRQAMLEELRRRNDAATTIKADVRIIEDVTRYCRRPPDRLGPQQLRQYQAHLFTDRKLQPGTVQQHVAALRFFYVKTLKRRDLLDELPHPQRGHKLPTIRSPEEVAQLVEAARKSRAGFSSPAMFSSLPATLRRAPHSLDRPRHRPVHLPHRAG